MATNKNAILRYNTLDKCFRNLGRRYYFEDLLDAVNEALREEDPETSGIKTRQLREDIRFMRSESGYGAPIITVDEGKKKYYRYEESSFSINNSPINSTEAEQLKNALHLLRRFDGSPGFEWVSELTNLLKDSFSLKGDSKSVISYESNIDYKGYSFITPIFNAIVNQQVLKVDYKPFNQPAFTLVFHPYFLKQYNGRWYAYGLNPEKGIDTWNLALDRIEAVAQSAEKYKPDTRDWELYFSDFIGPTRNDEEDLQEVKLLFYDSAVDYMQTKALHPSQKSPKLMEDGSLEVRIPLIPNYELETLILSFGEKVKVVSPPSLVKRISERINLQYNRYS